MEGLKQLTDATFDEEVLKSDRPVMVDFMASWCGTCKKLEPVVAEVAQEYKEKLKVASVEVGENKNKASQFGVLSVPCLIFFKGGQEVTRLVGGVSKKAIEEKLEASLGIKA